MNRFTLSLLALVVGGGILTTASAQTDVTSKITNPDFEGTYEATQYPNTEKNRAIYTPKGWTVTYTDGDSNDMTALKTGDLQYDDNFKSLTQPTNGGTQTYWTRFRWGDKESLSLSQTIESLDAGTYTLTADVFLTTSAAKATLSAGGKSTTITASNTAKASGTWGTANLQFTLAEAGSATITYTLTQTKQEETVAGIDNIKLSYSSVVTVDKDALKSAIDLATTANSNLNSSTLTTAIATAQAVYDNADATQTQVDEAVKTLNAAVTAAYPFEAGTYYFYDSTNKLFLSRGCAWGTEASADKYGVPVEATVYEGVYTLRMIDNPGTEGKVYINGTDGIYTDQVAYNWAAKKSGDGYVLYHGANYLTHASGSLGEYVTFTTDETKAIVWTLKTKAEHDTIVEAYATDNKTAVATAAGITGDFDTVTKDYVQQVTKTINPNDYTFAAVRDGSKAESKESGALREVYQGTGNFTTTLTGLSEGLYKVSINALERDGWNNDNVTLANSDYYITTAYLKAGDQQVAIQGWAKDRSADDKPNDTGQAKTLFDAGKYLSEVYTYVGSDGSLTLTIGVPSYIGGHWFIMGNTVVTRLFDGVTEEMSNTLISSATTLEAKNMLATTKTALTNAKTALAADKTNKTLYQTLSDAVTAAQTSADAYDVAEAALEGRTTLLAATNFYTADAKKAYYDDVQTAITNGTLSDEDAKNLQNPMTEVKWEQGHANCAQVNTFLGAAWGVTDFSGLYLNSWSTEGDNDGSNFKVPFYEYFANDKTALTAKTLTGTISGLTANGWYKVTADVREQLVSKQNATATGITMQVNDGEAVEINKGTKTADSNNLFYANYTAYGQADASGNLILKFIVADGTNVHWLSFQHVKYEAVTPDVATISSSKKFATYVTKTAVDFSKTEGLQAYKAKYDATAKTITLTEVTAVPANTAVVLYGAPADYTLYPIGYAAAVSDNDLQASTGVNADGSQWCLTETEKTAGFAPVKSGIEIPSGKAYLVISNAGSAKFLAINGMATGINAINAAADSNNAPRYNLAGQRVGKNYKGVVIVNGKKVIVK